MTPDLQLAAVEGLGENLRRGLQDWAQHHQTVEIVVEATGSRGAAQNALIARVQKGMERDFAYLDPAWLLEVRRLVSAAAARPEGWRQEDLMTIGRRVVDALRDNVAHQANPGGSDFRPLTESYAKRKQAKFGRTHPILVATGELVDSLKPRVIRRP